MRMVNIVVCVVVTFIVGILYAGASPIKFISLSHDFGDISETGGEVSHTFIFTNVSAEPIVVVNAVSSCGCTKTEFSRKPIQPNCTGEIIVRFNPMDYPGVFARKITILTSAGRLPEQLTISGRVLPRKKTIVEQYPLSAGGGLRLEANAHAFGYIEHGNMAGSAIGMVNDSDSTISLRIINSLSSGVLETKYPRSLKPNEEAVIHLTYILPDSCNIYGSLHDVMKMEVNGKVSEYQLTISAIAIDNRDNFADSGEPVVELSKNFIRFEPLKRSDVPQTRRITIYNKGNAPLHIRRVETEYGLLDLAITDKSTINVGESSYIDITIRPADCSFGPLSERVKIITDDPHSPMRSVRVSAVVEQ